MKFERKHFGTTASKVIIIAESDLEAEGIENCLTSGYHVNGAYLKSRKGKRTEFTIYPKASKRQLRELDDLNFFKGLIETYVMNPTKSLGRGLETQI